MTLKSEFLLVLCCCGFAISATQAYGATPFFADGTFTQNGIEWCQEEQARYNLIGESWFEHHNHSIESRICASLYSDPLWYSNESNKISKLIEKSRYYFQLEVNESREEAKTGIIDTKPAEIEVATPDEIPPDTGAFETNNTQPQEFSSKEPQTNQEGGGCLIATAAFGSEMSSQIQFLRQLRDQTIIQTRVGEKFLSVFNSIYYSFSPTIADLEREYPLFKETIKIVITPMISSLHLMALTDAKTEYTVFGFGVIVIFLNVGFYFVLPTIIANKITLVFKNKKK